PATILEKMDRKELGDLFRPELLPKLRPAHELLEKYFAAKTAVERTGTVKENCRDRTRSECPGPPLPHSPVLATNRRRSLLHQRKSRPAPGDVFRRSAQGIRPKYFLAAGHQAARRPRLHHRSQARAR